MSTMQRKALEHFAERGAGALWIAGSWVWKEHVRTSETIASAVVEHFRPGAG